MVSKPRGNKDMKVMTIYIEPEVLKALKIRAIEEGRSMTQLVNELVKKYLGT